VALRAIVRRSKFDCETTHDPIEGIGLGRNESRLRMKNVPRRVLDSVRNHLTVHKTSKAPRWCSWPASKLAVWGDDDGLVQRTRGLLLGSSSISGRNRLHKPYCHQRDMKYDFSGDSKKINNELCESSFLSEITNNVCVPVEDS